MASEITDPAILALMGAIDPSKKPKVKEPEVVKPLPLKPPITFEEFLEVEDLKEWPFRITSENLLDLEEERYLIGTQEEIRQELVESTTVDMSMFDQIEDRIKVLEEKLAYYAEHFLTSGGPETSEMYEKRIKQMLQKVFLTEPDAVAVHPSRKGKRKMGVEEALMEKRKKSVLFCDFPGFHRGESIDLPAQLEAPQLLNRVTKAQRINPGLLRFWRKVFQSEASVALTQDIFWWIFLEHYEPRKNQGKGQIDEENPWYKEEQDRIFDRIADSFVALFQSINPQIKDKIMQIYPNCIAQAVYLAFLEAFPESERLFKDKFKQVLLETIHVWMTGTKPSITAHKKWNMAGLVKPAKKGEGEANGQAALSGIENKEEFNLDMDGFFKVINKMSESDEMAKKPSKHFGFAKEITKMMIRNALGTSGNQPKKKTLEPIESHPVGKGPGLQRIQFNIQGRSPLVAHYMAMRELNERVVPKIKIARTEITSLPPEGTVTYRELIEDAEQRSHTLSSEYEKVCALTQQEIQKIEKQQLDLNRRIANLQREITFNKSSTNVRRIADRVMNNGEKATDPRPVSRIAEVPSDDLEDETDRFLTPLAIASNTGK